MHKKILQGYGKFERDTIANSDAIKSFMVRELNIALQQGRRKPDSSRVCVILGAWIPGSSGSVVSLKLTMRRRITTLI
jgi:hypothetical protein